MRTCTARSLPATERRRSRTDPPMGCIGLLVLKTSRGTGPCRSDRESSRGRRRRGGRRRPAAGREGEVALLGRGAPHLFGRRPRALVHLLPPLVELLGARASGCRPRRRRRCLGRRRSRRRRWQRRGRRGGSARRLLPRPRLLELQPESLGGVRTRRLPGDERAATEQAPCGEPGEPSERHEPEEAPSHTTVDATVSRASRHAWRRPIPGRRANGRGRLRPREGVPGA